MEWRRSIAYNAHTIDAIKPATGFGLLFDEGIETFAARLFHALEATSEVDRELLSMLEVVLENVEPAKDRTLVVG